MDLGNSYSRLSGSFVLDLTCSKLTQENYMVDGEIGFTSVLTGTKTYTNKGYHYSTFEIDVNLYKYGNSANTIYNNIEAMKLQNFYFYPHVDANPIYDIYGNNVLFHIKNLIPYYITKPDKYEAVKIQLESEIYTYIGNLSDINYGYGTTYGPGYYGKTGW